MCLWNILQCSSPLERLSSLNLYISGSFELYHKLLVQLYKIAMDRHHTMGYGRVDMPLEGPMCNMNVILYRDTH